MQNVSNLVQCLLLLKYGFRCYLLLFSNLVINSLRLSDFLFAFVLTFAVLFLLSDNFRNGVFLFVQIVEGVFGLKKSKTIEAAYQLEPLGRVR